MFYTLTLANVPDDFTAARRLGACPCAHGVFGPCDRMPELCASNVRFDHERLWAGVLADMRKGDFRVVTLAELADTRQRVHA